MTAFLPYDRDGLLFTYQRQSRSRGLSPKPWKVDGCTEVGEDGEMTMLHCVLSFYEVLWRVVIGSSNRLNVGCSPFCWFRDGDSKIFFLHCNFSLLEASPNISIRLSANVGITCRKHVERWGPSTLVSSGEMILSLEEGWKSHWQVKVRHVEKGSP